MIIATFFQLSFSKYLPKIPVGTSSSILFYRVNRPLTFLPQVTPRFWFTHISPLYTRYHSLSTLIVTWKIPDYFSRFNFIAVLSRKNHYKAKYDKLLLFTQCSLRVFYVKDITSLLYCGDNEHSRGKKHIFSFHS